MHAGGVERREVRDRLADVARPKRRVRSQDAPNGAADGASSAERRQAECAATGSPLASAIQPSASSEKPSHSDLGHGRHDPPQLGPLLLECLAARRAQVDEVVEQQRPVGGIGRIGQRRLELVLRDLPLPTRKAWKPRLPAKP